MSYVSSFMILSVVMVPTFIAVGLVWAQRKRLESDGRRSPIENRTIYGPGEQLRKRVDDHSGEILLSLTMLFFVGPLLIALWAARYVPWQHIRLGFWDYAFVGMYAGVAISCIWKIQKHAHLRRIATAGLQAELFTAQELNRLMALGCSVLHDIPGDRFNIDHVVVGPRAVYAVETKSVRKPKDSHKVSYDGEKLHFPTFSDAKRLEQTKRQADWLSKYLRQTLGQNIPVVPALALPGWWIETKGPKAEVQVFTPVGRGAVFMADDRGDRKIDVATVGLITQALALRYPTSETEQK